MQRVYPGKGKREGMDGFLETARRGGGVICHCLVVEGSRRRGSKALVRGLMIDLRRSITGFTESNDEQGKGALSVGVRWWPKRNEFDAV